MSTAHSILAKATRTIRLMDFSPGTAFGLWHIVGPPFRRHLKMSVIAHVVCHCDCGTIAVIACHNLLSGRSMSCGCLRSTRTHQPNLQHGYASRAARHPLYTKLQAMITRCHNPLAPDFGRYGGRGIIVCDHWRASRAAFIEWAIANGWQMALQIDRLDNDGPYSPDNCRFVDSRTNTRNTSRNRVLHAFGESKCMAEWAEDERCKVAYITLSSRISQLGWDAEKAIATPSLKAVR